MRILYLISYAGRAGTERYVADLMRTFKSGGHSCFLAFWQEGPLSRKMAAEGFPLLQLDMAPRHILQSAHSLAEYCRSQKIDIVHAQYPRENVIAVLSRLWRSRTKVVFTSHLTIRQPPYWRICNRWITPWDHAVIAVCSPGARLLRENGVFPKRICYIPNGLPPAPPPVRNNSIREEFGLADGVFLFLTLSRYVPEKGLDVLLSALCRVKKRTTWPFACLIAGEGPLFNDVRRKVPEYGLDENVIQTGFCADTDILLCSADAYVSSSVSAEAMSFGILEAMQCALPLAVTDVGAGRELAEGCGYVSPPGDAESLAEALLALLTDPACSRRLGEKARIKAENEYALANTSAKLMEIYRAQKNFKKKAFFSQ